jgi:hypothetical protein
MDLAKLFPLAASAALVTSAIEFPVSQYYATVPPTGTAKRMLIAGAMTFAAVLIGGSAYKAIKRRA